MLHEHYPSNIIIEINYVKSGENNYAKNVLTTWRLCTQLITILALKFINVNVAMHARYLKDTINCVIKI